MTESTPELRELAGGADVAEPYREIAKQLRTRLQVTRDYLGTTYQRSAIITS